MFRAQEVCEIAELQPYVLRTWEAEFPDLGVAKSADGPRVYRRADVERVLRIKHLLFVDGLTLAGARRRLQEEGAIAAPDPLDDTAMAAMIDGETRQHLRDVRRGLQWILGVLSGHGLAPEDFVLRATPVPAVSRKAGAAKPKNGKTTPSRSAKKTAGRKR